MPGSPEDHRRRADTTPPDIERPITARALLVAVIANTAVLAWVEYSELVTPTSQMSESTPPIPAILSLGVVWFLTFVWLRGLRALRRAGVAVFDRLAGLGERLALSRGEILAVYLFLIVSAAMPSVGIIRLILPCIMELQYFDEPTNHFAEMAQELPKHWAPLEGEPVRTFWEGVDRSLPPSGAQKLPLIGPAVEGAYQFFGATVFVPWGQWAAPFAVWSFYLIVYFIGSFCLVCLFRRKWVEDDHLAFPLATMSIEMVRTGSSPGTGRPFFRDPVMWIGFSMALVYNGLNMLAVYNPAVPHLGMVYPIGRLFTEAPWSAMAGMAMWHKPEIMGLGYLVPSEILLSIFVFSLAQWLSRPVTRIMGYDQAGFPWARTQAAGALIVLGLFFIYQARHRLWQTAKKALYGDPEIDDRREPLSYRFAFFGAVISLVVLVGFPIVHGVDWWQSLSYMTVGTLFLIAYCRNRGETGLPIVWGYPLLAQKDILTNFGGSRPFIEAGRIRSFTLLSVFTFLQRGTYYAITSTEQESCIVAETMGLGARRTAKWLIAAIVIGFLAAFWMYVSSYYQWGGNVMETVGGTQGGQRAGIAMQQFKKASGWIDYPSPPNVPEIGAALVGAAIALTLIFARHNLMGFPLHPVGYAFAACHENYMWFPALVILVIRTSVMRLGGMRWYRRLAPGFIAFTLGHFVAIGLWSFAGLYAGDMVQRYRCWFL